MAETDAGDQLLRSTRIGDIHKWRASVGYLIHGVNQVSLNSHGISMVAYLNLSPFLKQKCHRIFVTRLKINPNNIPCVINWWLWQYINHITDYLINKLYLLSLWYICRVHGRQKKKPISNIRHMKFEHIFIHHQMENHGWLKIHERKIWPIHLCIATKYAYELVHTIAIDWVTWINWIMSLFKIHCQTEWMPCFYKTITDSRTPEQRRVNGFDAWIKELFLIMSFDNDSLRRKGILVQIGA